MVCDFSGISDFLVAVSAVAASIFAYNGLSTWKKQLKGGAEYQLAKDVLKAVYRVREAFKIVRNPGMFPDEYPEEIRQSFGMHDENKYEGTLYAYQKRWEKLNSAFSSLEELHLEAQVEWGPQHQDKIVSLRNCKSELILAIQDMLYRLKNPNDQKKSAIEEQREERSVLYWGGGPEIDKFTPQIESAINEFEEWLRPKISHEG